MLAAAVRANAEVLVTFNLKDFPAQSVAAFDIEIVGPDDFLLDQLDLYPGLTTSTIKGLTEVYKSPVLSVDELLQVYAKAGVPRFAQEVRRHLTDHE